MSTGLHEDDFLIYIADTQERAIDLVPYHVKNIFKLSGSTIRRPDSPWVVGLVKGWDTLQPGDLAGIHGRVHVWATGNPTREQRDEVSNVASHWLSHVEWV